MSQWEGEGLIISELEAELASLDRRRFYVLSLLGRAQRESFTDNVQLTFVEELDGQDDD